MTYPKYIRQPDFIASESNVIPTENDSTGGTGSTITIELKREERIRLFPNDPPEVNDLLDEERDLKRAIRILHQRISQLHEEISDIITPEPNLENLYDTSRYEFIQKRYLTTSKPY